MKRFLYISYRYLGGFVDVIKIKLSPSGKLATGLLTAAAAIGIDTTVSSIYQLFSLVLMLLIVSLLASVWFRPKILFKRHLPRFVSMGTPFTYNVTLTNTGKYHYRNLSFLDTVTDRHPTYATFVTEREPFEESRNLWDRFILFHRWTYLIHKSAKATFREAVIPGLLPHSSDTVTVLAYPVFRGYIYFKGATLMNPEPLGLSRATRFKDNPESLLVLPKRYPIAPVTLDGKRSLNRGGITSASSVGNSDEFIALRDYRPGNPKKNIHWKSWAKTGKMIIKEYEDEYFVRHALVLDTFTANSDSAVFEEAVSVAASFAASIVTGDSILDLMFVGEEAYRFSSGRGMGSTAKMLELLACVTSCTDKPFSVLKHQVLSHVSLLSGCIFVCIRWDDEREKFIEQLKYQGISLKVLVIHPGSTPMEDLALKNSDPAILHLSSEHMEDGLRSGGVI